MDELRRTYEVAKGIIPSVKDMYTANIALTSISMAIIALICLYLANLKAFSFFKKGYILIKLSLQYS